MWGGLKKASREIPKGMDADDKAINIKNINKDSVWYDLLGLLIKIAGIAAFFWLLFTLVYGVYRCSDMSMAPSIRYGDLVLYYRLDKNLTAGDVAVVQYAGNQMARRVVAVAQDRVDIRESRLVINDAFQEEKDVYTDTTQFENGITMPVTLGQSQVFLLGDNRPVAVDSRIFGSVNESDLSGKVIGVLRWRKP